MRELLLAIVHLTSKGLQHGNITPTNVLFTSSGITKLGTYRVDIKTLLLIIQHIFTNVVHLRYQLCRVPATYGR